MGWKNLLIHFQTPTVRPLKFDNGSVISPHTLLGMWLLIETFLVSRMNPWIFDSRRLIISTSKDAKMTKSLFKWWWCTYSGELWYPWTKIENCPKSSPKKCPCQVSKHLENTSMHKLTHMHVYGRADRCTQMLVTTITLYCWSKCSNRRISRVLDKQSIFSREFNHLRWPTL